MKVGMGGTSIAIVVVVGAIATAAVANAVGMSFDDSVTLAGIASGGALSSGALGAVVLWTSRRRPIGVQIAIVALTAIGAVGAGAFVSARLMFLSDHDLHSLFVVLTAAGTVGTTVALALGINVARGARSLAEATRRIERGETPDRDHRAQATELATLSERLRAMSERLEAARGRERALDSSRRELIAWVSHDLRTPLSGIRAMAEALEDGVVSDPDTVARYHRTIRHEVERLAGLVDDLFELSRINAGALQLRMEQASIGDLVSDALAAAQPVAGARRVRLEGRLTSDAPELALSVPEMGRVLRNLLENAIRHTPSDGSVVVEAGVDDGRVFVSVADTCGGIPDDDLSRVFDVAFRGVSARSPNDGGAGLGLAIARGIVEAHRGEIEVRNAGGGCRFTVRLPMEPA